MAPTATLKLTKYQAYYRRHQDRLKAVSRAKWTQRGAELRRLRKQKEKEEKEQKEREKYAQVSHTQWDSDGSDYWPYSDSVSIESTSSGTSSDSDDSDTSRNEDDFFESDFLVNYESPNWNRRQRDTAHFRLETLEADVALWHSRWGGPEHWSSIAKRRDALLMHSSDDPLVKDIANHVAIGKELASRCHQIFRGTHLPTRAHELRELWEASSNLMENVYFTMAILRSDLPPGIEVDFEKRM